MKALARWCTRHRRRVVVGWWAAFALLVVGVATAGTSFHDSNQLPASDSATAYSLLAKAGKGDSANGQTGTIVWATNGEPATGQSARNVVGPMLAKIKAIKGVQSVAGPFGSDGRAQVSANGRVAYATVVFSSTANAAQVKTAALDAATTSVHVQVGGQEFDTTSPSETTDIFGVIAALLVLLVAFRSRRAAFLPIITGVAGVVVSSVAVLLLSHVIALSSVSLSLGVLIGLGVGIDYALLIVNRYIRALREGIDVQDAIVTAMDTSGRSVIFAGGTVIVALLGMLTLGFGFLSGMGVSAALTVLVTVAAAITLLPALLAKAGARVLPRSERKLWAPGHPLVSAGSPRTDGVWAKWAQVVQRRPVATSLVALAVMLALAAPVTSLRLGSADASSDPTGTTTRTFYDTMAGGFGKGFEADLLVVAETPDQASRAAWARLVHTLPTVKDVQSVSPSATLEDGRLATLTVVPKTAAQDAATSNLVTTLRNDVIRQAEAGNHLQVHVGGTTASDIDYANALISKLPLYLLIIAAIGFVLLAIAVRSLVAPAIGVLSNLLTIGVALGATVALFQWGWGPSFLGVGGQGPVEYIVVMLIVGVIFGLSMDYQVFLLSRMREEWARTGDHQRAVTVGVSQTGKVIATAAAIMFCVFASFGFSGARISSEFGVGLAIAVLADAFLMRMTIMPALTRALGRSNWALPGWLDRVLPNISIDGPAPGGATDAVSAETETEAEPQLAEVR